MKDLINKVYGCHKFKMNALTLMKMPLKDKC